MNMDGASAAGPPRSRLDRVKALRNAAVRHVKVTSQQFGIDVGAHHF